MTGFVKASDLLIKIDEIERVDMSGIEQGFIDVTYDGGRVLRAHQFDAFDILMHLKPAAMEGRRLRWAKNAWAFHNLVAHPVMQLLVWCGFTKAGIWVHDVTSPRPVSTRNA